MDISLGSTGSSSQNNICLFLYIFKHENNNKWYLRIQRKSWIYFNIELENVFQINLLHYSNKDCT